MAEIQEFRSIVYQILSLAPCALRRDLCNSNVGPDTRNLTPEAYLYDKSGPRALDHVCEQVASQQKSGAYTLVREHFLQVCNAAHEHDLKLWGCFYQGHIFFRYSTLGQKASPSCGSSVMMGAVDLLAFKKSNKY